MTHPMYMWLPWSNPPYVIAIYSKVLLYTTHTVVTHSYLREIVLPKVQRSRSLSPDSVAKWRQSPKVTLVPNAPFLYYSFIKSCRTCVSSAWLIIVVYFALFICLLSYSFLASVVSLGILFPRLRTWFSYYTSTILLRSLTTSSHRGSAPN